MGRHRGPESPFSPWSPPPGKEGLRQASPVSVYLFPGENGRPPAPGPAPGTPLDEGPEPGSPTGSRVEGEAVDADDFCILDAPGLGIPVSGGGRGQQRWDLGARRRMGVGSGCQQGLGAVLGEWKRGVGCTGLETRTPGFLGKAGTARGWGWRPGHLGTPGSLAPGPGFLCPQPRDGEPVVTRLAEGPVPVRDGHFSRPLGSTDLLRAPARFPTPESRVLLRDVSIVWHLYGGRDFGSGRGPPGHAHSPR